VETFLYGKFKHETGCILSIFIFIDAFVRYWH